MKSWSAMYVAKLVSEATTLVRERAMYCYRIRQQVDLSWFGDLGHTFHLVSG